MAAATVEALFSAVTGGDLEAVHHVLTEARKNLDPESFARLLNGTNEFHLTALQHAAWEGREDIVHKLLTYEAVDVNYASAEQGFTALHLASWQDHLRVVQRLLANPQINISARSLAHACNGRLDLNLHRSRATETLFYGYDLNAMHGLTALHCASWRGHSTIVETLVKEISTKSQVRKNLNALDTFGTSPLHHAVIGGNAQTVEELSTNPMVKGMVISIGSREGKGGNLTPLDMAALLVRELYRTKDFGDLRQWLAIISLLSEQRDVKGYIENVHRDRQVFVNGANAMLVGAALIASISFAGWLQPPLGFQPFYETRYLLTDSAAPPSTFASFATVGQHSSVQAFWIFNSLSFFFAITTVLTGASAVLPSRATVGNKDLLAEVEQIRTLLVRTTLSLIFSVISILRAFIAAGFASLPPTLYYQWGMIATSGVWGLTCLIALRYSLIRVSRLIRIENVYTRFEPRYEPRYSVTCVINLASCLIDLVRVMEAVLSLASGTPPVADNFSLP